MIVFANTVTPRLRYILDFIGMETTGNTFQITTEAESFRQYDGPKINYSHRAVSDREFWIPNSGLLFDEGIREPSIECVEVSGHSRRYKAFFKATGDIPFDIFAASFFLLSRYEEYLPHRKDSYGRYAHQNSLAFKNNFLHLPLINIWLEDFRQSLLAKFPELTLHGRSFRSILTYDIDEAYAYRSKQWWRTAGGFMKSLLTGQWTVLAERISVLLGRKKDPYDAFDWMKQMNRNYNVSPVYFFLVAGRTGRYDKNVSPSTKVMQRLIREHSDLYPVGIHPSWQSGDDPDKMKLEILKLGHISGRQITCSRQHYLRFTLPATFRKLIDSGIESDYSMGYGTINGFRASVASPFFWYDLEKEEQTKLLLCPFCFMDANSFYEQGFTPQQAADELKHYNEVVRSVNGVLITVWHNNFFGTSQFFSGWKVVFEQFVGESTKR